jgi:hypothetical protein
MKDFHRADRPPYIMQNLKSAAKSFSHPFGNDFVFFDENLAEIIPADQLFGQVQEGVRQVYWEPDLRGHSASRGLSLDPRNSLALLAYAYLVGVYPSFRVVQLAEDDATISSSVRECRRIAPSRLSLFRNHNSELVKRCLEHVLWHVCRTTAFTTGVLGTFRAHGLPIRVTEQHGFWNRNLSQQEAERRFRLAVESDACEQSDWMHFAE